VIDILDIGLVEMVITVCDNGSIDTIRQLAKEEGLLDSTSSGAKVF